MVYLPYPFLPGAKPETEDPVELMLNRAWRPSLAVIGADGLPPIVDAGNAIRAEIRLKLSIRVPPTLDAKKLDKDLVRIFTENPPYGSEVTVTNPDSCCGWNAAPYTEEFNKALHSISKVPDDPNPN